MRYREFFEVKLEHPYTPAILEYLTLSPSISSLKLLKGKDLLVKKTGDGFKVLSSVKEGRNDAELFKSDGSIIFNLFASSNDFLDITDFSAIEENKIVSFSNLGLSNNALDLLMSETSPNAKSNGFPQVGKIKINLSSILERTDQIAPIYTARFESKSMIWKYYFITKDDTNVLSVSHKNTSFRKLSNQSVDPVFTKLTTNFAPSGLQIEAFESEEPLACQIQPRKDIQLKSDSTTIISHLPNPEVGDGGIKIIRIN